MGSINDIKVKSNYIGEIIDGVGVVLDSTSCLFEGNQVRKCTEGGIIIHSNLVLDPKISENQNFGVLTIDQTTVHFCSKFGILVQGYFGLL